jgi:cell division transport system ATP-binding protein
VIEYRDVSLVYPGEVRALSRVNLQIASGELCFLIGATGAGKSSLLKLLYREEKATSGLTLFNGIDLGALAAREIPYLRRKLGIVFQDFKLMPELTIWENVAFAMRVVGANSKQIRVKVPAVLDLVGLLQRDDAKPSELSGGEIQRVCIARALVNEPELLLADEPTGNLDPATSWDIFRLIESINARGTTCLVATHNHTLVDRMRRRVVCLEGGTVVRDELEGGCADATQTNGSVPTSVITVRERAVLRGEPRGAGG